MDRAEIQHRIRLANAVFGRRQNATRAAASATVKEPSEHAEIPGALRLRPAIEARKESSVDPPR